MMRRCGIATAMIAVLACFFGDASVDAGDDQAGASAGRASPSATPSASPSATPSATNAKQPPVAPANVDDWAAELLKADPLAKKERVTVEDLRAALRAAATAETALPRHFARAELSADQRRELLKEALAHQSAVVRRQAAAELKRLGMLSQVVAEIVLELAEAGDENVRHAAVVALRYVDVPWEKASPAYRRALFKALTAENRAVVESAASQVEAWGADAVPELLDALRSGDDATRRAAAAALSRIIAVRPTEPPVGPAPTAELPGGAAAVAPSVTAKSAPARGDAHVNRELETDRVKQVRVYYGTNREVLEEIPDPRPRLYGLPIVFVGAVTWIVLRLRRRTGDATANSGRMRGAIVTLLLLGAVVWIAMSWNDALRSYLSDPVGVVYGPRRDPAAAVHYGYCDVSIPPTHSVGEVEQPLVGAEDEERHVMIRRNEQLAEKAFFDEVRRVLASHEHDQRDCFVFVHGYNVSFEKAARRTAQIHYDLQFSGVPLFYSWPSRANVRSYFSDRNEIGYSYDHIKKFLIDVAERVGAGRIHVIAHSMGADAVGRAVMALGERGRIFDQVILAAPDVDADVFREQIAPRLKNLSKRTTLYCSRNDWALHASYAFNDSWRLGDSSRGIIVLDGMDTVDASDIDTDLLGHSYYGDCLKLLGDVRLLIDRNLPPPDRRLSPSFVKERLQYWTFGLGE